ncbi:MAG: globin domain-containing protein [Pseudomonadota bacterium]
MTLTDRQIELVRESFAQIQPIAGLATELFCARLFAIAPHIQPLFPEGTGALAPEMLASLAIVIDGLDTADGVRPVAADIAARQVTYGITPSDYEPIGQALVWTLARSLDDGFTPEHRAAWQAAYAAVSETMVRSAYPLAAPASKVAAQ